MAKSVGCDFVLVGHSERRELFGETDELVGLKTRAILGAGSEPSCASASPRRNTTRVSCATCARAARRRARERFRGGNGARRRRHRVRTRVGHRHGAHATPAIAQSVHAFVRGWVRSTFGDAAADAVIIQYGGSVKPDSVDELMQCPDVDGCLVGGASLSADAFARIFEFNANPGGPAKLFAEEVAEVKNQLGESPVWDVANQTLWWVDAPGKALWSWDLVHDPVKAEMGEIVGFVALRANGTLLLGLDQSGIIAYDPRTRAKEILADFEPGLNTVPTTRASIGSVTSWWVRTTTTGARTRRRSGPCGRCPRNPRPRERARLQDSMLQRHVLHPGRSHHVLLRFPHATHLLLRLRTPTGPHQPTSALRASQRHGRVPRRRPVRRRRVPVGRHLRRVQGDSHLARRRR